MSDDLTDDLRHKLISTDVTIDATTLKLHQTQRAAAEAEQMGLNIYEKLRQQREQLERASRTLHQADTDIDESNRTLRNLIRRYLKI